MKKIITAILILSIVSITVPSCHDKEKKNNADDVNFETTSVTDHPISNNDPGPEFNTLVWSDEFDGAGALDPEKWFHQTQLPPGGSWFGGIIQHYTNREDNSYQKNGYLNLVAKKEVFDDQGEIKQYTSARLNSKFSFTYGRVEVKAKLPEGRGTWPAIWMLNKNINEDGAYWDIQGFGTINWPNCGEIDILEHWGKNQDYVSSALHNGSSYGYNVTNVGGQKITGSSSKFHIYSLEWTEEKIVFSVDGVEHFRYQPSNKNNDNWPYDTDYYLILNIAIEPDIDPAFIESPMVVDYIRVYQ
ncbi:MAG: glycoside hydrolase family 16 protein [Flavobacteriaceae bacterium]|nr:glycoside hydrolase family 16 protein [Flavobacteriaceae bacterium]NNK69310.1 glycoside hydrolase family 16 protein [Flavobacteriaceae bacterium]